MHPCDERMVSIRVRDLATLLIAATNDYVPLPRLDEITESYGDMLTRMADGSSDWLNG